MQAPIYRHHVRFCGKVSEQHRYQLQIFEVAGNGRRIGRAQWGFPTLARLIAFLQQNFPTSEALDPAWAGKA